MSRPRPPAGYALVREIGSGGFGSVWLARSQTGIWRAVKFVGSPSDDDRDLFRRELAGITRFQAATLGQPTQLAILHVETDDSERALRYVMELADDASGSPAFSPETYVPLTLRELRRRRGRIPVAEAAHVGVHIARALAMLHGKGLLHRDIKPSNIILVGGVPKLSDLGLVTSSETAFSRVGTQGYVAPEGPGTAAADLYSLGLVLFELATHQSPEQFPCLPPDAARWPDAGDFADFNTILLRLCARDPAQRHPSARELADDLAAFLSGRSITSMDEARRRWKRRGLSAIAALAVACAGFTLALREAGVARDRESLATARDQSAVVMAFHHLKAGNRAAARALWHASSRASDAALPASFFAGQLRGDPCLVLARSASPWASAAISPDSGSWIAASDDGRVAWGSLANTSWAWIPNLKVHRVGPWRPGGAEAWVVVSNRWRPLRPSDGRLGSPPLDGDPEGFSADGRALVALSKASSNVQFKVWRDASPAPIQLALPVHPDRLSWASLSPSGNSLAVVWFNLTNGLRARQLELWDLDALRQLASKPVHGWIHDLHAAPNGAAVYVADGRRAELHAPDSLPPRFMDSDDDIIRCSALAPDGLTWISGGEDGHVRWRNLASTSAPPMVRVGHEGAVASVAWLGGESPVVSFGTDGTVRRWTAEVASSSWRGGWQSEFGDAVLAPGGAHVLATAAGDRVAVLNVSNMVAVAEITGAFQPVAPAADGAHAWFLGPGFSLQLRTWPGNALEWESPAPSTNPPTFVIRSQHDVLLGYSEANDTGLAVVLPLDTNAPPVRMPLPAPPAALALRNDRKALACSLKDRSIVVLSLPDGRASWSLTPAASRASALGWSPDHSLLVAGRADGTVEFHRQDRRAPKDSFVSIRAHAGLVTGMVWDPSGRSLATHAEDGHLQFWDAIRLQPMGAWKASGSGIGTAFHAKESGILLTFALDGSITRWPMDDSPLSRPR